MLIPICRHLWTASAPHLEPHVGSSQTAWMITDLEYGGGLSSVTGLSPTTCTIAEGKMRRITDGV